MSKEKWNELCYHLSEKINGDISEKEFEAIVDKALYVLGWREFSGDFEIRPSFQLGSTKNSLKPDFLIKSNSTGQKLFVVEIKRPNLPLSAQNQIQLSTYMRQFKLPFGILIGPQIQVFYDGHLNKQENAALIKTIDFKRDSSAGEQFVELFSKESFSADALHAFAADSLNEINQKQKVAELTKRIVSPDFHQKVKDLVRQHLIQESGEDVVDAALEKVEIEIRKLGTLAIQNLNVIPQKEIKHSPNHLLSRERDKTKMIINGNGIRLPKNRFVLEFIRNFLAVKPKTFNQLKNIFRDDLQGSTGVINELGYVQQKYQHTDDKRHFTKEHEILTSADNIRFVVSTEWTIDNVQNIVKIAEKEGFKIDQVKG
ncbi:type I restriction enzyme HsdR N-terminal domain-containing protein [Mariniradius sediminis]|uniref:Type I restriction enzyme HsdR N-terminal domain-containing protein n=1 Tax=Mariniradius sediminis TaxID=2909237 RepID=A0ABS9BYP0_9BACT|nr:type I restriction enzyme HsdR N-terminal domain-containing protein [Mariniradius sediminis]MCF1753174.1 type I restriction enzyme HsdR N-terminal domain-containing protein [Mariniradius sediminis]